MTAESSSSPPVDDRRAGRGGADVTGSGPTEEVTRGYVRSPKDVIRLVGYGSLAIALVTLARWAEEEIVSLEQEVVAAFDFISPAVERVLLGFSNVSAAVLMVAALVVPLARRRYRHLGYLVLAVALGTASMMLITWWLDSVTGENPTNDIAVRAGIADDALAGSAVLAGFAAIVVMLGPFVGRRWQRAGGLALAVLVLLRLLVATRLPAEVFAAPAVGAVCGVIVLLAFGRPDRHPTTAAIRSALVGAGLPAEVVRPADVDARGSTPYAAELSGGGRLFVKVLGSEERAADLLYRAYRFVRLKDVGDARPFSSLRRTVEHEALVSLLARDSGARTPRMQAVVDVGSDSMLLAFDFVAGWSLDEVAADGADDRAENGVDDRAVSRVDEVDDTMLRSIWAQVADLRGRHIAHRDLRLANILIDDEAQPWMIDFGFSEIAVPDALLDADVAELLVSLSIVAGPERAVASAVDTLGPDAVGSALPRLQTTALSAETRSGLRQHHGLLEELQREVQRRCAVDEVEFVPLQRISNRMIVSVAVLVLATYFLLPQLTDVPGIVQQVQDADWAWTPLLVLASVMTYLGAAAALGGAVPDRLPGGPLMMVAVSSEFANKLAPAGLGGLTLNVRFLQKQGVDHAVAVSGVGLNAAAGVAAHVLLIVAFIIWAGRGAFGSFDLPDPTWFIVGIGVAIALIALGVAIPWSRRWFLRFLWPVLSRSIDGVRAVFRRPAKIALLFGGSALVTFSNLVVLYFAVEAFGGGLAFATVGAVYLVGSAVAQAAPTPGGLGAVEAALISGLVAAGLPNVIAVPAVFLFRLFTFWLPLLPGWFAFQWMQRHEYV